MYAIVDRTFDSKADVLSSIDGLKIEFRVRNNGSTQLVVSYKFWVSKVKTLSVSYSPEFTREEMLRDATPAIMRMLGKRLVRCEDI